MNIILNRQVFDKDKFNKTIDTQFSQLVEVPNPTFFDINLATIEDFFTLYNNFFFQIPKFGETNSHEYIVKESGQYINIQSDSEEINALLDEISQLRQENLEIRQQNIDLVTQLVSPQSGLDSNGFPISKSKTSISR